MDYFDFLGNPFFNNLEVLDIVEFGFPRRRYERSNYFEMMDDLTFFKRFRLTKPTVLQVLLEIEEQLEFPNDLNNSVTPINQLLTALRYYATGGHLASVADFMGMYPTTASRIIAKVSRSIASLGHRYIYMPEGEELLDVQNSFFRKAAFPRVLGCVDGTHIRIQSPGGQDAEVYRNRKGYFSINTQVVGDSDLRIRDIVARWPGSAHDSTIFNNSRVRATLESGHFRNCLILGDSGYALTPYLLTPAVAEPRNRPEQLYNEAHIRTRNTVERLFGVWKRRFPVLAYGMRVHINTVLAIIVATGVLHNMAINSKEGEPPNAEEIDMERLEYLIQIGDIPDFPHHDINEHAINTRNLLINNYFGQM